MRSIAKLCILVSIISTGLLATVDNDLDRILTHRLNAVNDKLQNTHCLVPFFRLRRIARVIQTSCQNNSLKCAKIPVPVFGDYSITTNVKMTEKGMRVHVDYTKFEQCKETDILTFKNTYLQLREKMKDADNKFEWAFYNYQINEIDDFCEKHKIECGDFDTPPFNQKAPAKLTSSTKGKSGSSSTSSRSSSKNNSSGSSSLEKIKKSEEKKPEVIHYDEVQYFTLKEANLYSEISNCYSRAKYNELREKYLDVVEFIHVHGLEINVHALDIPNYDDMIVSQAGKLKEGINTLLKSLMNSIDFREYTLKKVELEQLIQDAKEAKIQLEDVIIPEFHQPIVSSSKHDN